MFLYREGGMVLKLGWNSCVDRSSAECNNFSEGSSEHKKDALVIQVREAAAPRVYELQILVLQLVCTYV